MIILRLMCPHVPVIILFYMGLVHILKQLILLTLLLITVLIMGVFHVKQYICTVMVIKLIIRPNLVEQGMFSQLLQDLAEPAGMVI